MTAAARIDPLRYPFEPPVPGAAVEVAEGVLWLRLPLPMALDHVNLYALDDGDGWTLIDAGLSWGRGREALAALRAGALGGRPIRRLVLTHHHPDHVGMAATLVAEGAELWATRTAWLFARMLTLDHHDRPTPQALAFYAAAGWPAERLAAYAAAEPFNFSRVVEKLPQGFRSLAEGDVLTMGGRRWRVRLGGGHAPDHASFWAEDGSLVLTGDQALPRISPNVGVYPTEPEADPLADWLEACARLGALADDALLALPGHQRPFHGLATRFDAIAREHAEGLAALRRLLRAPATVVQCFPALYRRPIGDGEFGLATAETMAHLNHLARRGEAMWDPRPDGARLWRLA